MFTESGSNQCEVCSCKIPQCQRLCREHELESKGEKNAT